MLSIMPSLKPVSLGDRVIGPGQPVFVVAEIGVNHDGRVDRALELVDAARQAGADCVKFQTFAADRIATAASEKAPYQRATTRSGGGQRAMLKSLELPLEAYPAILRRCHASGLVFLSTPYSPEDVDFLHELDVPGYKVASAQIVEPSFLAHVARTRKPILLSTGMATLAEVDEAVRAIRAAGNDDVILLQCTTSYPAPVEDANLRALEVLRVSCGVHVGYSDHTPSILSATAAVALGAVLIERHLTLDSSLPGPDHAASADPAEFREYVEAIRQVERAMGTGMKVPSPAELSNLPHMRRSIVARDSIPAGTVLTSAMLTFKRPATGITPARLDEVVGARTRVVLAPDHILLWSDLDR
jgi:N,N'-diacetyllegionaminate synthase